MVTYKERLKQKIFDIETKIKDLVRKGIRGTDVELLQQEYQINVARLKEEEKKPTKKMPKSKKVKKI